MTESDSQYPRYKFAMTFVNSVRFLCQYFISLFLSLQTWWSAHQLCDLARNVDQDDVQSIQQVGALEDGCHSL